MKIDLITINKYLLILAALLLSAALPLVLNQTRLIIVLALIVGGLGMLLLLRNPYLGYMLLIGGSLLVPYDLGTGTNTGINPAIVMGLGLTGIWIVDMIVIRREITIIQSRALLPPVMIALSAVFSFFIGQLPWFPIPGAPLSSQIGGTMVFVVSAALLIVTAHQIKSVAWLERLTWLFIACAGLYLLASEFISPLLPPVRPLVQRLTGTGMAGSIFWVWIFAIGFSQLLGNSRLRLYQKGILLAILAVAFYSRVVISREWSSGWVPAMAAVGVIGLIHLRWSAPFLVIFGLLVLLSFGQVINNFLLSDNEYSLSTRVDAWLIAAEIIKVNPFFGFGAGNYHFYTSLYPIRGYFVPFNSHNNYIDLLLQVGFIGFAFFTWLLFEIWRMAWKLQSRAREGFAYAYVLGCLGGVAGTAAAGMLGDWVIPFVYNVGLRGFRASMLTFLFFGGLVALDHIHRKEAQGKLDVG